MLVQAGAVLFWGPKRGPNFRELPIWSAIRQGTSDDTAMLRPRVGRAREGRSQPFVAGVEGLLGGSWVVISGASLNQLVLWGFGFCGVGVWVISPLIRTTGIISYPTYNPT